MIHLFFKCPLARQVLNLAPLRANPDFSTAVTLHDCFMIMSTLLSLPPTEISKNLSSWLLRGLWMARNLLVFENRSISAEAIVERSIIAARELCLAQATGGDKRPAFSLSDPTNPLSSRCSSLQYGCCLVDLETCRSWMVLRQHS